MNSPGPSEKNNQKYGDTMYDLLVPVDPIQALKLVEPTLIYTKTSTACRVIHLW